MKLNIVLAIIQDNDLLLFQRRKKDPYKNLLGLLGGKRERGEDLAIALRREVLEESGLRVANLQPLGIVNEKYHSDNIISDANLYIYHATCSGTIKHSEEEGEAIWISLSEFESFKENFIPADWIIVNNYLKKEFKDFNLSVFKSTNSYSIIINC